MRSRESYEREIEWLKKCLDDLPHPPVWISVEQRLPPLTCKVLTYGPRGSIRICNFYKLCKDFVDNKSEVCAVTHWMPLPDPPKIKDKEEKASP